MTGLDREALAIWLLSRLSIAVVAAATGWLLLMEGQDVVPWLDRWVRWDFFHYRGIAESGYGGEPTGVPNEAFFPGFPALLWLGHQLGLAHVVVGLLVSVIAGGVAAVALAHLGELEGGREVGRLAVVAWVCAPPAVFLAAPYTEALFLACALPAWLAARRGHWLAAGVLASLACTVRVSGIFLAVALGVHWLVTRRDERSWSGLPWLFLPLVPLVAWMAYLKHLTGNWLAWLDAQAQEWNREFTWPWDAWANTWRAAFGGTQSPGFAWMFGAELVATVLGVALTVALGGMRGVTYVQAYQYWVKTFGIALPACLLLIHLGGLPERAALFGTIDAGNRQIIPEKQSGHSRFVRVRLLPVRALRS
jgi:hypothetical protein